MIVKVPVQVGSRSGGGFDGGVGVLGRIIRRVAVGVWVTVAVGVGVAVGSSGI